MTTRDYISRMISVGIREFKAKLSAYVRHARAGEVIVVTDRGRPVAELHGPESARGSASQARRHAEAVAAGWLRPPAMPADRTWLRGPSAGLPPGAAAALLDAERADH